MTIYLLLANREERKDDVEDEENSSHDSGIHDASRATPDDDTSHATHDDDNGNSVSDDVSTASSTAAAQADS